MPFGCSSSCSLLFYYFHQSGVVPRSVLSSKKAINHPLQITDRSTPPVYSARFLNTLWHLTCSTSTSTTFCTISKKGHAKRSLPCCLRTLQGIQVQASKLILYCWTFQRPLTRLTTQSSSELHQYGIRGTALSWIRAFTGNRSQTVVLEGEESGSVPVTSGCPRGQSWGLSCSLYT